MEQVIGLIKAFTILNCAIGKATFWNCYRTMVIYDLCCLYTAGDYTANVIDQDLKVHWSKV